jgi:CDP-paratose 2-epimerase
LSIKRVLITGGAGFTGTNLAAHHLAAGRRVVIYDNLSRRGATDNVAWLRRLPDADRLEVLVGDCREPTAALKSSIASCEAVFHLAGQVAVTRSVADPRHDFENNALATLSMLELVRQVGDPAPAFFFSSTNKVYGGMENVPTVESERRHAYRDLPHGISESRPLDFHSPYGCSKGCADQYVLDYARIYGLRTVVFRQSCIYGYRQFGIEDQGWVAWFVIAAVLGRPLTIFGDGKQVRDVLFIDDLIAALDAATERIDKSSGRVFNIGGGPANSVSLLELLDFMRLELDLAAEVRFDATRPGDQPVYVSDIRRAGETLNWEPRIGWQAGVRRLVGWVRDNRELIERTV